MNNQNLQDSFRRILSFIIVFVLLLNPFAISIIALEDNLPETNNVEINYVEEPSIQETVIEEEIVEEKQEPIQEEIDISNITGIILPKVEAIAYEQIVALADTTVTTMQELNDAIAAALPNTMYTIAIGASFAIDAAVVIPTGKQINIESSVDLLNPVTLSVPLTSTNRHFSVNGSLTLGNIILDGSNGSVDGNNNPTRSTIGGGIILNASGSLSLNDGAIIQANYATTGGGVDVPSVATFVMNPGSEIRYNTATSDGGGLHFATGRSGSTNFTYTSFTMNGGSIRNNTSATNGGGVYFGTRFNNLQFTTGTFSDNTANNGGALWIDRYNTTTINSSTFTNNTATTGSGGAILFYSADTTATITGSTFTGNTAASYGGAISATAEVTITVNDSSFNSNSSTSGGAIYTTYGRSNLNIYGSTTFTKNTATGDGGAIYTALSIINIYGNLTVENNTANGNGGGLYGQVIMSNDATLLVNSNIATTGGGGIYATGGTLTLTNANITNNTAGADGGGINYNNSGTSTVTLGSGVEFEGNLAGGRGGGFSNPSAASSGIYPIYLNVNGATFTQNSAAYGGGIFVGANKDKPNNSVVTIVGGTFLENTATGTGGSNTYYGGGAIATGAPGISITTDATTTFTRNSAVGSGGAISMVNGSLNALALNINGSTFTSNTAGVDGGAIFAGDSTTTITSTNATFTNNSAVNSGGAIRGNVVMSNTILTNNQVTGPSATGGGALYIWGNSTITNSTFRTNKSTTGGGAVYIYNRSGPTAYVVTGTTFTNNTAATNGGAIYLDSASGSSGTLQISTSTFTDNTATTNGGAIYTYNVAQSTGNYRYITVSNTTNFSDNVAGSAYRISNPATYPLIQAATTSIFDHPLNNFDINYSEATKVTLSVYYNDNYYLGNIESLTLTGLNPLAKFNVTSTTLTRTGYDFLGWSTNSSATTATYHAGNTIRLKDVDMTLYAIWRAHPHTLTFDANGGTGTTPSINIDYDQTIMLNKVQSGTFGFTRDGYKFVGWSTVSTTPFDSATGIYVEPAPFTLTVDENVTLYAIWKPIFYVVDFVTHGADNDSDFPNQKVQWGTRALEPEDIPVMENHTFDGWVNADLSVFNFNQEIKSDTTIYALWDPNIYRVLFDSQGGSDVESQYIDYGTEVLTATIPANPTKEGHTFSHWSLVINGTEPFNFNTEIEQNITLFAVWDANEYKVAFNPNIPEGVTSSLTTKEQTIIFGQPTTLPTNLFTLEGFEFVGWSTTPTGPVLGTTYTLSSLPDGVEENQVAVTLYAIWNANIINVQFSLGIEGTSQILRLNIPLYAGQSLNDINISEKIDVNLFPGFTTYINQAPFNGDVTYSHVPLTAWYQTNGYTFDTVLTRETSFYNYLLLRRFTVTFVDPEYGLFGDTVMVPFGSNLLEPAVHHPGYILPANATYGWYVNVIPDRPSAVAAVEADGFTSATPRMPGNSDDPTVDSRVIIVPMAGITLDQFTEIPIEPEPITESAVGQLEEPQEFNFAGAFPEDNSATHSLNVDIITSNLVLTRQSSVPSTPTPTTPPREGVLGATRTPSIPTTGNNHILITVLLLSLGTTLLIKRKTQ